MYFYIELKYQGFINPLNQIKMLGLFKKKTEKEKLQDQYTKLLKEAHTLSTTNRRLSDQKVFEAEEVMKKIEQLD